MRLFAEAINKLEVGSIVGAAGARQKDCFHVHNLSSFNFNPETISRVSVYTGKDAEIYEVATIDECFFGMKKETYRMLRFNENICTGWHLYAVELSLHAKTLNYKVYVAPIQVHHFSQGQLNLSFYKDYRKLAAAYHQQFNEIKTTCIDGKTSVYYRNKYVLLKRRQEFFKKHLFFRGILRQLRYGRI